MANYTVPVASGLCSCWDREVQRVGLASGFWNKGIFKKSPGGRVPGVKRATSNQPVSLRTKKVSLPEGSSKTRLDGQKFRHKKRKQEQPATSPPPKQKAMRRHHLFLPPSGSRKAAGKGPSAVVDVNKFESIDVGRLCAYGLVILQGT